MATAKKDDLEERLSKLIDARVKNATRDAGRSDEEKRVRGMIREELLEVLNEWAPSFFEVDKDDSDDDDGDDKKSGGLLSIIGG